MLEVLLGMLAHGIMGGRSRIKQGHVDPARGRLVTAPAAETTNHRPPLSLRTPYYCSIRLGLLKGVIELKGVACQIYRRLQQIITRP